MDDARKLEADLLCGVLDALPFPTVLLDRDGHTVYVNAYECSVDFEEIHFYKRPDVIIALETGEQSASRLCLEEGPNSAWGLLELNPIHVGEQTVGLLAMFHPEKPPATGPLREIHQANAAERIAQLLSAYGDSVEAKRRAAEDLGIGLSTLYRIMAKEKKK